MKTALEICKAFSGDNEAVFIGYTWNKYNTERNKIVEAWKELQSYIFATDTTGTTNRSLPWKNSTTIPKLCQIRDNLHSNYISALFPNDEWLKWVPYSSADAFINKSKAIEGYMSNKCREGHFRTEMSKLLYDYIDYGNAFASVYYENSFIINANNEKVPEYIGPRVRRISPLDIVFNPLANSFKESFKIVRSLYTIGELKSKAESVPDDHYLNKALANREKLIAWGGHHGWEDLNKINQFQIDGFGNFQTYLQGDYVEVLDFYGDINREDGTYERGQHITVIDRMWIVNKEPFPSWLGCAPIFHAGWRTRQDNLWSMGPLENLVGMQYRIDHLENVKADAMDLAIMPPLVIQGDVEEFEWKPNAEIHIDENGAVTELARNVQWVIQADNAIDRLEMRMEQYAGAPREAMGIRTPGEKTKFEVQELQNAAGRIFQEKITHFEIELLEPVLNGMIEVARRRLDRTDVIRVMDDDLGVTSFMEITKDDITASGKLRPIGARHFAAEAQIVQNLVGMANTPIWQQISPHMNTKKLAMLVEDMLGLDKFQIFKPNSAIFEGQEQAQLANIAQEDLQVIQDQPVQ